MYMNIKNTQRSRNSEDLWSDLDDVIGVDNTELVANGAVTTLRAKKFSATPREIKVTVGGFSKTVVVTTETVVKPADVPSEPSSTPTIKQNQTISISLNNLGSATVLDDDLKVASADQNLVSAVRRGKGIFIEGVKPTANPVRVTVTSNGRDIKTYDVTVAEALDRIDLEQTSIVLREGDTYTLLQLPLKVISKSNSDLKTTEGFKPKFFTTDAALASINADNTILTAVRAPTSSEPPPRLVIRAADDPTREVSIPITINPAAATINLAAQSNVVFVNKSATFGADVLDSQGNRVRDAQIQWSVHPDDQTSLAIMNAHDTQVTVQGLSVPKDGVRLIATLAAPVQTEPVKPKTFFLNVKSANVTGFAPLQIRIDLVDEQTAKDLFGKKAADEFFISKIRLFNKLKNQNGEFGDSILVYSESLELRVQLEMRDKKKGGDWKKLTTDDYKKYFGEPEPFPPDVKGTPACQDNPHKDFVARYRPYTFDIVANTHDRRDERSVRSRILTVANGLSTFASFVTTIAVPTSSNDTRLGLDQFKGLLVPSFEKLFPSLKEVQRQNIITMVMRPLEEIPFGSDVSRILFIPKSRLYGMMPDKVFRIGGVSTLGACAEVGIVKKAGSTQ
jgi:hypothetical protein